MATDTSAILAGNPFKLLASTASASAVIPSPEEQEDVPITNEEDVTDEYPPPEQAISEQAKDIDTDTDKMESQKMSALEHSLTRDKEKNEEVKPVSSCGIYVCIYFPDI